MIKATKIILFSVSLLTALQTSLVCKKNQTFGNDDLSKNQKNILGNDTYKKIIAAGLGGSIVLSASLVTTLFFLKKKSSENVELSSKLKKLEKLFADQSKWNAESSSELKKLEEFVADQSKWNAESSSELKKLEKLFADQSKWNAESSSELKKLEEFVADQADKFIESMRPCSESEFESESDGDDGTTFYACESKNDNEFEDNDSQVEEENITIADDSNLGESIVIKDQKDSQMEEENITVVDEMLEKSLEEYNNKQ
ncbi:hypothetical protein ACFLYH_01920 [Candidatus Dependentiae bacterium]